MTNRNLNELITELKSLEMMSQELAQEIDGIKDSIKRELTTRNSEEVITENYKISYKPVTSSRFDSKAFATAEPTLYEQYKKSTTSMRLTIR